MLVLIITDIWEWTPFLALIFLAGLQVLPPEPFEAALIEGASPIKIFRYITIPMLKDLLAIAFLLRLMDSLKTYDIIYIITQGGPGEATQTLNFNAYVQGFIFGNISIAAAQMLMMTIATILLTVILVRLTRERV
jgi:multiple sugar transport system permease protein